MSASGRKLTWLFDIPMSASAPIADIRQQAEPQADIA
jgi:hypothetical protein